MSKISSRRAFEPIALVPSTTAGPQLRFDLPEDVFPRNQLGAAILNRPDPTLNLVFLDAGLSSPYTVASRLLSASSATSARSAGSRLSNSFFRTSFARPISSSLAGLVTRLLPGPVRTVQLRRPGV